MRVNVKHTYIGIIIILCIIATSSVLGYQMGITNIELTICVLSFFSLISNLGSLNKKYIFTYFLLLIVFLLLITIIEVFVYWERIYDWIRLVVLVLLLTQVGIFTILNKINVIGIYYKIFRIYIVLNTLIYILVNIVRLNIPTTIYANPSLPQYSNYFYLYYSTIGLSKENILGIGFVRNDAIFTEPGLYAAFLVFMLLIFFYSADKSKLDIVLIIFGIFSTFSTTGILLTIFIIFIYFVTNNNIFTKESKIFITMFLFGLGIIAGKMILEQKAKAHVFSFSARSYDLISGIKMFFQKPVFGWGYKNFEAFYSFQGDYFYDIRMNSNGFVSILYQLGIGGASLFIGPFIMLYRILKKENKRVFFMFSIIMVVIIMGEPIQYDTAGLFILSYIFSCIILRKCMFLRDD